MFFTIMPEDKLPKFTQGLLAIRRKTLIGKNIILGCQHFGYFIQSNQRNFGWSEGLDFKSLDTLFVVDVVLSTVTNDYIHKTDGTVSLVCLVKERLVILREPVYEVLGDGE